MKTSESDVKEPLLNENKSKSDHDWFICIVLVFFIFSTIFLVHQRVWTYARNQEASKDALRTQVLRRIQKAHEIQVGLDATQAHKEPGWAVKEYRERSEKANKDHKEFYAALKADAEDQVKEEKSWTDALKKRAERFETLEEEDRKRRKTESETAMKEDEDLYKMWKFDDETDGWLKRCRWAKEDKKFFKTRAEDDTFMGDLKSMGKMMG